MRKGLTWGTLFFVVCVLGPGVVFGSDVTVKIESLAPASGTHQAPFWLGFHDGTFDVFDAGSPASAALEMQAEDGSPAAVSASFVSAMPGGFDAILASPGGAVDPPPVFSPGDVEMATYAIPNPSVNRYFSFTSMLVPSNDAFVGNDDPMAYELFDNAGNFLGPKVILILGSQVWDAGTEVNDEAPMNTALFGQMTPNTGADQNGVVALHSGYMGPGNGGILDDPMFANADFKASNYQIARITITPEPASLSLFGLAGLGLLRRRSRSLR